MSRIGYNTFADAQSLDVVDLLDDVRHAGFTGVGLYSEHAHTLAANSAGTGAGRIEPISYCVEFVHPDRPAQARLDTAVRTCHALGAPWLVVIPGPDWARRAGWRRSLATLLSDLAAEVGVLLEPLSAQMAPVSCLHTVDDVMAVLDPISPDRGGWVLDTAQLLAAYVNRDALHRLQVVQIADLVRPDDHPDTRVAPGRGCLPIADHVRRLTDAGYRGWWEAEVGHVVPGRAGRAGRLRSLHTAMSALVSP